MRLGLATAAAVAAVMIFGLVGACSSGDDDAATKTGTGADGGHLDGSTTTGTSTTSKGGGATSTGTGTGTGTDTGTSAKDSGSDAPVVMVDSGPPVPDDHSTGLSMMVNGTKRTYDITVPLDCATTTKKVPLVFVYHGDGGRGADVYGVNFPLEAAATAAGDEAVFVYPDGTNANENNSAWNIYDDPGVFPYTMADPTGNEDVDYFDAMVTAFEAQPCVDASRVLLTGVSNGAYMTNQLARWRSSVVKGNAPQSGGPPAGPAHTDYPAAPYCIGATKPVPSIIFHGTADDVVDPALGEQTVSYWDIANMCSGSANDCSSSSNTLVVPPASPTAPVDPSPCVSTTGCADGAPVVFCFIPGMGHTIWENAPTTIWTFFSAISGT